nr:MAG TPA: hypothetical protein [Caudoviricetes sp.]
MKAYKKRRGFTTPALCHVLYNCETPLTNPRTCFSTPNGSARNCSTIHAIISSLVSIFCPSIVYL